VVDSDELNRRMERTQWDFFWVDDQARVIDRHDVAYTVSNRNRPFLNCVYRTRSDRLAELVSEVRGAHEGRSSRWLVYDTSDAPPDLEASLRAGGYEIEAEHMTCVIDPKDALAHAPRCEVRQVRTRSELDDALDVLARAFELARDDQDRDRLLAACTGANARVTRFVAYLDGEPASAGGINVYPELRAAYLWGGGTVPELRGRGAYAAVLAARLVHARLRGIEVAGIYARTTTAAPVVRRFGFRQVGRMVGFSHPAPAAPKQKIQ
jgi:hypothetical protein